MRIGMVGLGRMGSNMTRRLLGGGHKVVVFDVNPEPVATLSGQGAIAAGSLAEVVEQLEAPRAVWLMLPAGAITQSAIDDLHASLEVGDVIVDGGNSRHTDSRERAAGLAEQGIRFVDAGVSGGIWGLKEGFCLMVGGEPEAVKLLEPIFETLAPPDGYAHVGASGAGHYVKMIHNGIEYALMQSYGEGLELLRHSDFELDLAQIAEVWRHGSVIRSWLLDLTASALRRDPDLSELDDYVEDSGEGRWTVEDAIANAVPAPLIALSLFHRFASRQDASFTGKVIAALRREFGGHAVKGLSEDR